MPIAELPQSNKQHAVPQNIMDVEFKLVGDLTMRQFSYLLIFGILSYLSVVAVVGIFKIPLAITSALLGLGLAFVPVGERGMDDWIASFIRAINSPTQRVWKKEPEIPFAFSYRSLDVVKQELITLAPTSSRRKLEEYLKYQVDESQKDPLDIPEQEYLMKVRNAFAYNEGQEQSYDTTAPSSIGVSVIDAPLTEPVASIPDLPSVPEQEPPVVQEQEVKDVVTQMPSEPLKSEEKTNIESSVKTEPSSIIVKQTARPAVHQTPKPRRPIHLLQEGDLSSKEDSAGFDMLSITPDMHSGRKFTNLLPSVGDLVLPIRGERMLRTSDQVRVEGDLKEKTEKLQKLLIRIREKENVILPPKDTRKDIEKPVAEVAQEAEVVVKDLQDKNEKLSTDIENLKRTIKQGKSMSMEMFPQEEQLKRLEDQKEKMASSYTELERKYQELQKEMEERKKSDTNSVATMFSVSPASTLASVTRDPNVVSGVVKDSTGKLLSNVLLIIKNKKGEAVRAFKTNAMGQFLLLSPLDNGIYTVEVSRNNNLAETFAIIPVEVKGEVLPTMEFVGK